MHLWILTIGSSDVQLISDTANQAKGRTEKQRSDKVWSYWYNDDLRGDCYDISFEPKQLFKDKEETYRIAPRILGRVYQASDQCQQKEIWDYLTFPLLDNFVQALANYPTPEAIAILLTDQLTIFENDRQRKPNSPYWQDTCELQPILQKYCAEKFPDAPCEFIPLTPKSEAESLDNWNAILNLVRDKFRNLKIADQPIQVNPDENVYVSHQAGTPAISSAVQFCSLAKFGDRVQFLVSNENNLELTGFVGSSSYLRGIKREQAKKLLDNYDYAGVNGLINEYLQDDAKILLKAALKWNVAKFSDFLDCLKYYPKFESELVERTRDENWWWIAYEEAYLAVIREKQDNIVEAFFHSFRAFEYIFAEWGSQKLAGHFQEGDGDNVAFLKESILDDPRFRELTGDRKKAFSGIQSKFKKIEEKKACGEKIKREDKVEFQGNRIKFGIDGY
jgi:hypothetical protein